MQNIHNFQIELVQGCTRKCPFCGIGRIPHVLKSPNYMTIETATSIATQIQQQFKKNLRVDFAVHGEPLMHPKVNEILSVFRKALPQAQLSIITNGDLLSSSENVTSLFTSGLNNLMVDFYDNNVKRNAHRLEILQGTSIPVYNFYTDKYSIWTYKGFAQKAIIITPSLEEHSGESTTRTIHTAGGNLPDEYRKKYLPNLVLPVFTICAKPFREMSINWDGNVSICCEDWMCTESAGNIHDTSIIDIWTSDTFDKWRYLLYHKRRDLIPLCSKCNEKSFRTGFLKIEKQFPELLPIQKK